MLLAGKLYKIFFYVLVYCILLLNLQIIAQNKNITPNNFPELKFEHITIEDELSQNSIICILQDSRGFLCRGIRNG